MRLYRFAIVTVMATYVLLIVGGLVHATGSSLACPDWPLCHGSFLPEMNNGVEYEHSHRLAAGLVAALTCVLGGLVLRSGRRDLFPLAIAAPVMVLVQALLGGLTVLFRLPRAITLSHLTLSMVFFSTLIVLAARLRPQGPGLQPGAEQKLAGLRVPVALCGVAILGQIALGGLVRHSMAGLACITFPSCFGSWWPMPSVAERIHMAHRYGAVLVALAVVGAAIGVFRRAPAGSHLRKLAVLAIAAVLLQGTLGVLSVTTLLHRPMVVAHLGGAALLLAFVVWTWSLLPAAAARRTADASPGLDLEASQPGGASSSLARSRTSNAEVGA